MKPLDRVLVVSDCLSLAGLPEGSTTQFAGQQITLKEGQAMNAHGQLGGSAML